MEVILLIVSSVSQAARDAVWDYGALIQFAGMIVGAIVLVAGLRERITTLSDTIKDLTKAVNHLDERTDAQDVLLASLRGDMDRMKEDVKDIRLARE